MKPLDYITNLLNESVRILLNPSKHWNNEDESNNLMQIGMVRLYLPGLIIVFLAVLLGDLLFESEYGFLLGDTLVKATRKVLFLGLMLWAAYMLIYEISKLFHVPVSIDNSRRIATYSMLPILLVYIVIGLFPFMDIVGIFGFYSLYLVYTALSGLYEIHINRNTSYVLILLSLLFLAFAFIGFLLNKLTALIIY